jgi:periplasmic protein CpxP/Spy
MKRFTFGIVMASVLALAAYSAAGAQPRGGSGGAPRAEGPGAGRGVMMMLRGLDLTDQQRAEVRTILQAQSASREAFRAEARLHRKLRSELFADAPDTGRLADLQQQLVQAQADRLAAQIATGQQVAQVLTAEQRAAARERLAQAPAREGTAQRGPGAWRERGRTP